MGKAPGVAGGYVHVTMMFHMPKALLPVLKGVACCTIVLGSVAFTAGCLALAGLLATNTLVNDGNWVSTKETLGVSVMGARSFMARTQALAGRHLNLDSWHGYQELASRDKMDLGEAEFDFCISKDAYFAFLIDKGSDQSVGFRISGTPDLKSVFFVARADGEFVEQQDLKIPDLPLDRWHHLQFSKQGTEAVIRINGQQIYMGTVSLPPFCTPGFRGGQHPVKIDNVRFRHPGGMTVVEDTFFTTDSARKFFVYALLCVFLVNLCAYYATQSAKVTRGAVLVPLMVFNVLLAVMATLGIAWLAFVLRRYPSAESLNRQESTYLYNLLGLRNEEVMMEWASQHRDGFKTILFVGSSQTFGAGAAATSETFVRRIQERFDAEIPPASRYRCINAGINGSDAKSLLPRYRDSWLSMNPDIVVFNLGANDCGLADIDREYPPVLEEFVRLNEQRGITTMFVLEALSWETAPNELETHEAIRRVASAHGIKVVDTHGHLNRLKDRGFLWWDHVHPTSFGHRLIADCIYAGLQELLMMEPAQVSAPSLP